MLTTVEESLEMTGVISFIWGLLVYLADMHKELRFRFNEFHEEAIHESSHKA
jgi:hypothetical protein